MDFKLILEKLLAAFEEQNIRYALIVVLRCVFGYKEMKISQQAVEEFLELSRFKSLKKDMEILMLQQHDPFIKKGEVYIDVYIEFVTQFNEFINHQPKPFRRIIDRDMRL